MAWLYPILLWSLLAVPIAMALYLWAAWQRHKSFQEFGDRPLLARLARNISTRRRRWKSAVVVVGVLFLAVALAGPRFGTKLREVKREGIDLVIALDVSLSMMAEDVAPNRLERSKNEIKKLLDGLRGDRVGLVIFAGEAFIQCPLTTDYSAVRLFLDVAGPDMIATPGTDFGAALNMATQAYKGASEINTGEEERTRALLFVSDGENHVANLTTLRQQAEDEGIVVFAAGVGETEGVPIPVMRNGRRAGFKKDRSDKIVSTRLEEEGLKDLSESGSYYRIARTSSSLSQITEAFQRLQQTEMGFEEFEDYDEKYQWPLALGLLFLFAERFVTDRRIKEDEEEITSSAD